MYYWPFGWPCILQSSCRRSFLHHCVPPSLFFLHWGIVLLSCLGILLWGASLLMCRCLLTWLLLLCWFLCHGVAPCKCLGQPCFHLFSFGHVLSNDWDLPVILPVSHCHLNFLCINAESNLHPFILWIPTHLDPHVVPCILKIGYSLVLRDDFRSYRPCVGFVVLYVTEISSKCVGIATSSLGIQTTSH
jgi:hypothetical protein